jgi:hypothetical protein
MFAQFEEKGKIYTQVVSKIPVDVIVQTTQHTIRGKIHIRPDIRLKDELNIQEPFLRPNRCGNIEFSRRNHPESRFSGSFTITGNLGPPTHK